MASINSARNSIGWIALPAYRLLCQPAVASVAVGVAVAVGVGADAVPVQWQCVTVRSSPAMAWARAIVDVV